MSHSTTIQIQAVFTTEFICYFAKTYQGILRNILHESITFVSLVTDWTQLFCSVKFVNASFNIKELIFFCEIQSNVNIFSVFTTYFPGYIFI